MLLNIIQWVLQYPVHILCENKIQSQKNTDFNMSENGFLKYFLNGSAQIDNLVF